MKPHGSRYHTILGDGMAEISDPPFACAPFPTGKPSRSALAKGLELGRFPAAFRLGHAIRTKPSAVTCDPRAILAVVFGAPRHVTTRTNIHVRLGGPGDVGSWTPLSFVECHNLLQQADYDRDRNRHKERSIHCKLVLVRLYRHQRRSFASVPNSQAYEVKQAHH